jgi:hypothetical protein
MFPVDETTTGVFDGMETTEELISRDDMVDCGFIVILM